MKKNRCAVGLDIGTTSISATVIDLVEKKQIKAYCIQNDSKLKPENVLFAEADADYIVQKALTLVEKIIANHEEVCSIGVTGQMHGIVYVDEAGNAVSPLMTWQDKRADAVFNGITTYSGEIKRITQVNAPAGYGFATHFYNIKNGLLPKNACRLCSIMDYVVMKLVNKASPSTHSSVGASFGFFDAKSCTFKKEKIEKLGICADICPEITDDYTIAGYYEKIPVAVAIGDNQASFLGSVKEQDESILVNIGTGSQISIASDYCTVEDGLELRPLAKNKYLMCGAALCGGSAYALLENFFKQFIYASTNREEMQYNAMNKLASRAYSNMLPPLCVDTHFSGSRINANQTGAIAKITDKNFTPEQLTLGFIFGMCNELKELYDLAKQKNKTKIIASGNAVQKISVLKNVLSDVFNMQVCCPQCKEEASTGAALFSLLCSGVLDDIKDFSDFINYI